MAGRLAVDFGTSNTVLALWDEARREGVPQHIPDFGHMYGLPGDHQISVVPSLIHYCADRRQWIGNQVIQQNLLESERTFRWMKRYVANRVPRAVRVDGRQISLVQAGRDFLSTVLLFAAQEFDIGDEEIALTVPVESFEHYGDWLAGVADAAGMPRFRLIDEPSAAALGYGAHIQPGNVYLIFDFGGGTLDVAAVLIEEEAEARAGRRCRVLGKAGTELGGMNIDQWLFQEVLRRNSRHDGDEDARRMSRVMLHQCEQAKERLSFTERAGVSAVDFETGAALSSEFTRDQFEELLDQHDVFAQIDRTIRRVLNASRDLGYSEEDIRAVLMVGGSSFIPSVQRTVRRIFGQERVMLHRPLDAVARGAAAFVAGVDFYDHIQHDYAIRHVNRSGDYEYRPIVPHGTPYPTSQPIAQLQIKSTYEGQTHLGIAIFEIGEQHRHGTTAPVELVFDASGAARVVQVTPDEEERRAHFWMNETTPTFLTANPPAKQGEPRFDVEFSVDGNKRLLITARDLSTNRLALKDFPVVRLT